jgi:SPP1 family predicted phage head-tail adaptor
MNPGKLRDRVIFQRRSESRDSRGQPVIEWQEVATVWASARVDLGDEQRDALRVDSRLGGSVILRYHADITPDLRLLWQGQQWEIKAVADLDGRKKYLRVWMVRHV